MHIRAGSATSGRGCIALAFCDTCSACHALVDPYHFDNKCRPQPGCKDGTAQRFACIPEWGGAHACMHILPGPQAGRCTNHLVRNKRAALYLPRPCRGALEGLMARNAAGTQWRCSAAGLAQPRVMQPTPRLHQRSAWCTVACHLLAPLWAPAATSSGTAECVHALSAIERCVQIILTRLGTLLHARWVSRPSYSSLGPGTLTGTLFEKEHLRESQAGMPCD